MLELEMQKLTAAITALTEELRSAKAGNSNAALSLTCERGDDGITEIAYNGSVIGWVKKCGRENYQAMTPRGDIGRYYTHRLALNHIVASMA